MRRRWLVPALLGGTALVALVANHPVDTPDGWVVVVQGSQAGGEPTPRYLVVPLDGGDPIEMDPPAIRPIGPPGAKG